MVVIKTGMSELPQVCEECRYYGVRPHPYDGWMDMCELCGEKLDCRGGGWDYDGNKRADNCPLMEVEDGK